MSKQLINKYRKKIHDIVQYSRIGNKNVISQFTWGSGGNRNSNKGFE